TPENAPRAAADDPLDWLLPAFWAVCIFMLSTSFFSAANTSRIIVPILHWLLPAASHRTIETLHMVVRKMAHITEYAVLFLLLVRGPMRGRPAIALAICLAYAFLDEGHQIFVPSRTPALHDVALDFSGALVASLIMAAVSTPAKAR
ncbi:MAG TPA: VanZ family protein, partial [Candidatus Binataceae bacterium]|nr:VanZ family protein [Candidatus Binataceae bacterium]